MNQDYFSINETDAIANTKHSCVGVNIFHGPFNMIFPLFINSLVSGYVIIATDNGLLPMWCQAITEQMLILVCQLDSQFQWNVNQNMNILLHENLFRNAICKVSPISEMSAILLCLNV